MTNLKFFLWLLTGSTLLLAWTWWFSLRNYSNAAWSPRPGGMVLAGHMYSATIGLLLVTEEPGMRIKWSYLRSRPAKDLHPRLVAHYRPYGHFWWVSENLPSPPGRSYRLEFPIWVPWLLFVSGAFGACRWMEKRAGAAAEKNLAEGEEAGDASRARVI